MVYAWSDEEIDVAGICQLYELRHACNVLGISDVACEIKNTIERIEYLYLSNIHGSVFINELLRASDVKFSELLEKYQSEHPRYDLVDKKASLIEDLEKYRSEFAGIGTNKAKRRLNKLATTNPFAKAVRTALEIEDKNICAKKYQGTYKDKIYNQKSKLINDLCKIFKEQKWNFGIQDSDLMEPTHVIYFEIPICEQISWHYSPDNLTGLPQYDGKWDKKINSTLGKLEKAAIKLLGNNWK